MNLGWRTHGGWSVRAAPLTLRFVADALANKLGKQYRALAGTMTRLSRALGNPSELVTWPEMLRGPLRDLTHDILLSREITESGLFDSKELQRTLTEHFSARTDHHGTLYRALEVALGVISRC